MQSLLPAGWLAFTGRELNPLERYKRFQITFSFPFSGFILAQGKFHDVPPMKIAHESSQISSQNYTAFRCSRKRAGAGSWPEAEARADDRGGGFRG
jgi:hypothetical protein